MLIIFPVYIHLLVSIISKEISLLGLQVKHVNTGIIWIYKISIVIQFLYMECISIETSLETLHNNILNCFSIISLKTE